MVAKPGQYQFSFNAGELAPAVWGNTGLKQFFAGAAQMLNAEPIPQGGFRAIARTRFRSVLPLVMNSAGQSAVRIFEFTYARNTAAYVVVLTPALATIFKQGVQVAQLATPYNADDLPMVKRVQRFDTMLLFHSSYPPGRILRNGTDTDWSFDQPSFTNIPSVQLDQVTYNNVVIETWSISINWAEDTNAAGTVFLISVDGEETNVLLFGTSSLQDIANAINALPTVDAGVTITDGGSDADHQVYELVFTGGTNPGANFVVSARVVNTTTVAITTYRNAIGVPGGEPLFSASAGYVNCGRFIEDRLTLGGFASKQSAFAMSQTGEYFNLNIRVPSVASSALLLNLDTDGAEEIVDIVESKYPVILTTEKDYYIAARPISASTAPSIVESSTYGSSSRVPAQKQESGVIYVNRDETIVFAATYDAVSEAFVSDPLSLLSSHLIFDTRDAALQKSFVTTDGERYWLLRDDGVAIVGVMIRNQDVTGFIRYVTDGTIEAVAVDGDNVVTLAITRQVDGNPQLFLETVEEGLLLDAAITITNAVATAVISGLEIHDGATVWAIADGYVEGPFTVANGSITLAEAASVVTVGRWTAPVVQTLPLARDVAAHTVLKRPARVHTVILDLIATTSVAIGANGQPAQDIDLVSTLTPTDQPPAPFTGQRRETGLAGWSLEGQVVITQLKPGALQIRDTTLVAKI